MIFDLSYLTLSKIRRDTLRFEELSSWKHSVRKVRSCHGTYIVREVFTNNLLTYHSTHLLPLI